MSRVTDMTFGNPVKLMLKFAVPLIITNIGQQLYMIVDASIVGRGVGVKALAAVGCTDWSYWLFLWSVISLTQGFATFVSRYFGEKDYEKMNKAIANAMVLCAITSVILTVIGLVAAVPLLRFLKTPDDVLGEATMYLMVMLSGTVIVTAYNMMSSIFRAFGDGKTPLIAMIISAVLNIALDILFVFVFHMGVLGAAIATLTSQLFSFMYCVFQVKNIEIVKLKREHFRLDAKLSEQMLKFSLPLAIEYTIISIGGMFVQSTVNLQGSAFVAGYTAGNKLYGLLECTAISMGCAFTTFISQNYGAQNYDRVKKGLHTCEWMSIISAVVVMAILLPTSKMFLSFFIDAGEVGAELSLQTAYKYYTIMLFNLIVLYLIYAYRCPLQGVGNSFWSMVSGVTETIVRIAMAKAVFLLVGTEILFYIEPLAWLGALLAALFPCYVYIKRLPCGKKLN